MSREGLHAYEVAVYVEQAHLSQCYVRTRQLTHHPSTGDPTQMSCLQKSDTLMGLQVRRIGRICPCLRRSCRPTLPWCRGRSCTSAGVPLSLHKSLYRALLIYLVPHL